MEAIKPLSEIKQEIFEIHELFQGWYQGVLDEADLESKIGGRLATDFQITFPDQSVHTKGDFLGLMRSDWGNDPKYRIVISDIVMLDMKDDLYRVSYTETQYWYGAGEPSLVIHAVSTLRESLGVVQWVSIYETKVGY